MEKNENNAFWNPRIFNELLAGSVGGAAQVLVGQPLDTIKTRAQIASEGMFKGPMDVLIQTVRKEGFLGLYKGMASPLLGIAAVNSLLFTAYNVSKRAISPFPDLTLEQIALAGSMAGAANAILASPVELFKIRMQGQYGSATDRRLSRVFWDTWTAHGFRKGVMRGYWVTVAREIPAYGAFYSAFEFGKRSFQERYGKEIPVWALLSSGSLGGISYWLACYPLDVVKSRVQLSDKPLRFFYISDEIRAALAEGGPKTLFKGLTPSWKTNKTISIPAAAATFAGFELTREFLKEYTGI
ncbi:mitochondrial carrier [Serendipita vermifera]|nr:mitochondrial carrier [Serendipita vermifera]